MKSTSTQYGRVAIALHWAIAALIAVALASGFAADSIGAHAHGALRAHAVSGVLAGLLTLVRVGWWWMADTRPDGAPNSDGIKGIVARITHALLIIVPLGMAASGIGMLVLSGAGAQLFGGATGVLPEFETVPPRLPHGIAARVLVALAALHIGAAIYHQIVLRDGLMARLAWGRAAGKV
jgi:cytochrome b561